MRAIATDRVVWSVGLCVCVCMVVTVVSPPKTTAPIDVPLGALTQVGVFIR